MEQLKIPYGINQCGDVVSAKDAIKGEIYTCISCSSELMLKAGEIREKHFSHTPLWNCNPETIVHLLAKKLVAKAIQENSKGNCEISLKNKCSECSKNFTFNIPRHTFSKAEEEAPISGFVCDVIAYRENNESFGIEIFKTHKVDEYKAESLPIHWIEVHADEILDNPSVWKPINSKLKPVTCYKCRQKHEKIVNIARKWGVDSNIFTTKKKPELGKYIAEVIECFSCKNEIPVFWWDGVPYSKVQPPLPTPHTIQYKYSNVIKDYYYMNTCPNCNVALGDHFIFVMRYAPFEGLPMRSENHPVIENKSNSYGFSIRAALTDKPYQIE